MTTKPDEHPKATFVHFVAVVTGCEEGFKTPANLIFHMWHCRTLTGNAHQTSYHSKPQTFMGCVIRHYAGELHSLTKPP